MKTNHVFTSLALLVILSSGLWAEDRPAQTGRTEPSFSRSRQTDGRAISPRVRSPRSLTTRSTMGPSEGTSGGTGFGQPVDGSELKDRPRRKLTTRSTMGPSHSLEGGTGFGAPVENKAGEPTFRQRDGRRDGFKDYRLDGFRDSRRFDDGRSRRFHRDTSRYSQRFYRYPSRRDFYSRYPYSYRYPYPSRRYYYYSPYQYSIPYYYPYDYYYNGFYEDDVKFYNFDILNEDPEIYRLDKFSNSYQNEESYDYGTYNYKEQQGQAIQEHLDDIAAAFRSENYIIARSTARAALMQYPDDMGLLMIGSQAEFASEDYKQAATLLRKALTSQDIEKYGVPVPAQLYANDQVWAEQIDRLLEAVLDDKTNPELNLLLGYQLFASGDIEISKEFLNKAVLDHINRRSARVLLDTFNSAEQAGDLGEKK